jgi:ribose 5-phosphate isomerase B
MRIALGSDHAGFEYKQRLKKFLEEEAYEVFDCGANSTEPTDYPEFAQKVARLLLQGVCQRGILICATGIGMSIAANRFAGIRAAICHEEYTAKMSRLHNDANIFCAGAKLIRYEDLQKLVKIWLNTPFEEGRHLKRLKKIDPD